MVRARESLRISPRSKSCPECGEDLKDVDIITHRNSHWGGKCPDKAQYPEAARRWKILTEMAKEAKKERRA